MSSDPRDPPAAGPGSATDRSALGGFDAPARRWFAASFQEPTDVQARGWPLIQAGRNALLVAPTGSGKTLAAFFACLDRLGRRSAEGPAGVRVLYVSPLKALVYDIERNLRAPLVGLARAAEREGVDFRAPRVAVRTGDTPARERRAQGRDPAEILVTTPESLYLILGSQQRETLASLETVIVDEIHALAGTKRGAHLALSLERVAAAASAGDPQRIGLSATAHPLAEIARYLGGDREVDLVDAHVPPRIDLEIRVPVPDMTRPELAPVEARRVEGSRGRELPEGDVEGEDPEVGGSLGATLLDTLALGEEPGASGGMWPVLHPPILEAIRAHRSTIVFVNSRGLCERLANRLNELAGEEIVLAHHGSIAHDRRREIEESLKAGRRKAIVATSSLELGIDMGAVDLVLLVESPGAVARGLQRVGRAGHQVGAVSRGLVFPKHRGDLLEAAVVGEGMRAGAVEPVKVPGNPLDVLAQQIVAMASVAPISVDDLERRVRRTASYRDLSREQLVGVLDMLAGRYPSTDFGELRPRILWDRERDRIEARRGAAKLALLSGGTIPDRGLYGVHLGHEGPRIGELDEEMVYESRAGEVVTLGASSWRVLEITRDRVIVEPAPGEPGKLPFWKGEGPGRPIELGRALGAFARELADRCRAEPGAGGDLHARRAEGERWLRERYGLDEWAARNLVEHLADQFDATGTLPSDRAITIERFRDELGDWRVCILSPFGSRIHAPWALAIESRLAREAGVEVQTLWSDDGIVLRFASSDDDLDGPGRAGLPDRSVFLPEPEEVEERVIDQLDRSALFAGQFRENAARALLLPRRRPGARTPLWTQRLRAQNLLAVAREYPSFPIMLETYRSCLQDTFDVPGLVALMRQVRDRRLRVDEVETATASPFARSLVFAYTAVYLYQGDVPVAERRAQALTLDRHMLRDLLGQEELRELLDAAVIADTEAELQGLAPEFRARHPDGLHDLLRRVGDLARDEIEVRCETETPGEASAWLASLEASRRAVPVKVGGVERWIAAEEAGLYRDALGVAPPGGLPLAFLEEVDAPVEQLALRFARHRGPFVSADLARRFGLVPAQVDGVLAALESRGKLVAGEFHPQGSGREWCDPEVLRRLRRRTLARLRGEVAPVEDRTLARFLPRWHGVAAALSGDAAGRSGAEGRLDEVLEQLEGIPLPWSELERSILPARVAGYDPRWLDELGALGQWVWIGCGSLGDRDGRVALYRRDRVALLAEPPPPVDDLAPLARRLLEHLEGGGASFFNELVAAAGADTPAAEVLSALWDLVWAGHVTNDTTAPLRALAAPARGRSRGGAGARGFAARRSRVGTGRGSAAPSHASGRWSRVEPLLGSAPDPTRRAHARALMLLERYGVVSRETLGGEQMPGGFAAVYPVLRAMEESGKLRRGHFVEGLSGAQFAYAGAVDRLRAARVGVDGSEADEVVLLAACDPAQVHGTLLPWPATRSGAGRPRRAAGNHVVLVGGDPVLLLERGGGLLCFGRADDEALAPRLTRAARALRGLFADRTRRTLRIDRIDGDPAAGSDLAGALLAAGFRRDYRGLVLERSEAR
ncbi:MAG: Lhr family helicase [Myxococcota bacterium]